MSGRAKSATQTVSHRHCGDLQALPRLAQQPTCKQYSDADAQEPAHDWEGRSASGVVTEMLCLCRAALGTACQVMQSCCAKATGTIRLVNTEIMSADDVP